MRKLRPSDRIQIDLAPNRHSFGDKLIAAVRDQDKSPTYEEAVEVLERAEKLAIRQRVKIWGICWYFEDNQFTRMIVRCGCGELVISQGNHICKSCTLLAALTVETEETGPVGVRFERAERALNRLALVVDDLQKKTKLGP